MTDAASGHGTNLIWNKHRVAEISGISGPSQSRATIDVTSHDSEGWREFIGGLASGGEISLEGNLIVEDIGGQVAFHTDMQAGTVRECLIILPMSIGAMFKCDGFPQGFSSSFPVDDKISWSGSITMKGRPSWLTTQSAGMTALVGIEQTLSAALVISPAIAVGTYKYTCTVDTASTWIKLTVTAATHTIYVDGATQTSGVQGGEIALNDAGEDTEVTIIAYEANKSARIYTLVVTRP